jgi:hypothetical protein
VQVTLWLAPWEVERLRSLLTKEADRGEMWALILREYLNASIVEAAQC